MRSLTTPELDLIRSGKQFCVLGLMMYVPEVVAAGVVSVQPSSNDRVVELSWSVNAGSITNVKEGMTCWIGSSANSYDKGVVRIRRNPSQSILYIGETSEIYWTIGTHVTIVKDFAIWRRDLRVVDETTYYMDWDILYTNQHSIPAPLVNMGPDAVVDITNGEAFVQFDARGSSVISGEILSYSWSAPTASSSFGTLTSQPTFGFDTVDSHLVSCTITTTLGATHTGYRFVHAVSSESDILTEFQAGEIKGSIDDGGWQCSFTVNVPISIPDRARVIIFARDFYDGVESKLGFINDRENLAFVGWVIGKTITVDPDTNYVSFRAAGPQQWIKMIKGYPSGLEDTDFADNGGGSPNSWTEMSNLTPAKALWHFLHWRSTATLCIDIYLPSDTRQAAQISATASTLWEQLVAMSTQVNLSRPCCDKFGRLFVLPEIQFVSLDERSSIPVIMDILEDDYSDLEIELRDAPGLYYAEVSGVWYSDGTHGPLGAKAPGSVYRYMGEGEAIYTEVVMGTQDEANELAGLVLGSKADRINFCSFRLKMMTRVFDLVPHSYVRLSYASEVDQNFSVNDKRLTPRNISLPYENEKGFHDIQLECEPEGLQLPAVAMTFPNEGEPPTNPPRRPPRPPVPPTEPPGPEEPPEVTGYEAIVSSGSDVRSTADIDSSSPVWVTEL